MKRLLPAFALTLVLAAPAHDAEKTGVREVCARSTYVSLQPGRIFSGTLVKHQTIRVTRFDASGRNAYGFARGHINRYGWVKTSALCD